MLETDKTLYDMVQYSIEDKIYVLNGEEAAFAASSEKNIISPLEGFSFDATDVTTEVAQRNQIYGDTNKLLRVGLAGDTQTAINKMLADSEAAGLQTILDEYQK